MAQVDGAMGFLKHGSNEIRQQFVSLDLDTMRTTPWTEQIVEFLDESLRYIMYT